MASVDPAASGAGSSGSKGDSGVPRRRTLRLLIDTDADGAGGGSGSGSGGLRRLSVQAATLEELHSAVSAAVWPQHQPKPGAAAAAAAAQREDVGPPAVAVDLELYDPLQERFGPLPEDFGAIPTVLRLRVSLSNATSGENSGSSSGGRGKDAGATLALPWRRFPVDLEREGFQVGGRRLVVRGVENSGQGTGHTTWDGAVLLAKYLEHAYGPGKMNGKRVLETGAGTGLVGLACAALGAKEVLLTDLPYTLRNLEANARQNEAGSGARVRVLEGDWFKPPPSTGGPSTGAKEADTLGPVDLIVAADVVWLDELVAPLAQYLRAVLDRPGSRHAEALMAYQTRSTRTEALLLEELGKAGLSVERVDPAEQHPEFRAPGVLHVFRIRLS